MGAFKFSPGHCGDCGCGCEVTFNVEGCGGNPVPGATVEIWTDGAKATSLGSGTTDGSGVAVVTISPSATWYWEATHVRFDDTPSGTESCVAGTASVVPAFSTPAAGYQCWVACGLPLSETLHYSDPYMGAVTLNWNGTEWEGTTTKTFPTGTRPPGLGNCNTARTLTVTFQMPTGGFTWPMTVRYGRLLGGCSDCQGLSPATCTSPNLVISACPTPSLLATVLWAGYVIDPLAAAGVTGTLTE